jgi:histidyl-tRNA synthetase
VDNTKFGPPKGMRDWLPQETLLRQKLIRLIEHHYQLYGFQPIDTPTLENIEVLQGKGGGENEKLMFKVLKRGEDLEKGKGTNDFADMGLRFDLTVPLARYYANHANDLPKPFRCYHIGPVWRADRPQKGRFREFYQCDIDIVGGASDNYEVELLLATDRVLKALGLKKFKIRVSDKRLLSDLLTGMGVETSKVGGVALALDKLDKQSHDQVMKEIEALGHSLEILNKVDSFIKNALHKKLEPAHFKMGQAEALWRNIESVRQRVHDVNPEANVVFDPLLVRGFDYYTGLVFEINVEDKDFTFSIGGGGRYDGLIEKLGGPKGTPAVGISLGFERILLILSEQEKSSTPTLYPRVFIANNGQLEKDILALAEVLRSKGVQVEACLEKKDFVKQMKGAQESGIEYAITEFKPGEEKIKVRRLSTRQDEHMSLQELEGLALSLKRSSGL